MYLPPSHKELTGKIRQAITALEAGKIAFLEQKVIAVDLLNISIDVNDAPKMLLDLLRVTLPRDYAGTRPPQKSYAPAIWDSELYAFKKDCKRTGCVIYYKFAIKDGYCWLASMHEDRPIK